MAAAIRKRARWCARCASRVQAKFFSGDCIVTEELVTAAGGPQFTNGVLMTFGQDPRTLPDGKAVIEKFRASGFEPEGYTLYAYASIQAIAAAGTPSVPITPKPATG